MGALWGTVASGRQGCFGLDWQPLSGYKSSHLAPESQSQYTDQATAQFQREDKRFSKKLKSSCETPAGRKMLLSLK